MNGVKIEMTRRLKGPVRMTVVLEADIDADAFELGRLFSAIPGVRCELETAVPVGGRVFSLVRVFDGHGEAFEQAAVSNQHVRGLEILENHDGEALYSIEWDDERDAFIEAIRATDGHVLEGHSRDAETWQFELFFPDRDRLSAFHDRLLEVGIPFEVRSIGDPDRSASGDVLSEAQREALVRAIEQGYYDIPRQVSAAELADEFDISDQAMSERLRRAIAALGRTTFRELDE